MHGHVVSCHLVFYTAGHIALSSVFINIICFIYAYITHNDMAYALWFAYQQRWMS